MKWKIFSLVIGVTRDKGLGEMVVNAMIEEIRINFLFLSCVLRCVLLFFSAARVHLTLDLSVNKLVTTRDSVKFFFSSFTFPKCSQRPYNLCVKCKHNMK